MATRLYPHSAVHGLSGTFPTSEQDSQAPNFSATNAATLRGMDAAKGQAMALQDASTIATTSAQVGFMGFWASPPLNVDQTVGGASQTISVNIGAYESNTNANLDFRAHVYVWRPSTGALIGDCCAFATTPTDTTAEPTVLSIRVATMVIPLAAVSALAGDVIIVELWTATTQSAAASYTVRAYYDGTVETATENAVVTDHAAYFEFSQNLTFSAGEARLASQAPFVLYTPSGGAETRLVSQSVIVLYVPLIPIDIDGQATDQVSAIGDLSSSINLSGQAEDQVSAIGNINAEIFLEGSSGVLTATAADLTLGAAAGSRFVSTQLSAKVDIDLNPQAAKNFYREVRRFAERTRPWQEAIFYDVQPDERWDLTLVSKRVYGRRDEYLAVLAAAGLDMFDQGLTQKRLVLPSEAQLNIIKRKTGFESIADLREDFAPIWLDE
jgi:hypothetical protein